MNLTPVFPITLETITPFIGTPAIMLVRGNRAFFGVLESADTNALTLAPLQQPTVTKRSKIKNKKAFRIHNLKLKAFKKSGQKVISIQALTPEKSSLTIPLVLVTGLFVFPDAVGEEH